VKTAGKQELADQIIQLWGAYKSDPGAKLSPPFISLLRDLYIKASDIKDDFDAMNDQWKSFHKRNPQVYKEFERVALALYRTGKRRASPNAILGEVKDRPTNDYSPYYARLFRQLHGNKSDLFRLTPSRADSIFPLRRPI